MDTKQHKNISLFTVHMPQEVDEPLLKVLHSGYIGQGQKVDEFEQKLSNYIGTRNILTLNNGTAALHLAMRLAGVEAGTEVITTPMTCSATNEPILANGGKIVWADIDPVTGLIDPLDVERKITPRTKAIVCVDWGGNPCDLDKLMEIGEKYNIKIIEDAAHGFGSTYKGRKVGTIADFTIFSFQAIKHITTVDGGLLTCKSAEDYRRGKLLRWYGIDRETDRKDSRIEEDIKEWGYKFHMNDVCAVIGIVQLDFIDKILEKHRLNAMKYDMALADGEMSTRLFYQPAVINPDGCAYWLYTMLLPNKEKRLEFMQFMKENGVMVSQVHARNDTHTTFRDSRVILPGVTAFTERMVCIPVHHGLSDKDVDRIISLCNTFKKL